MCDYFKYRINHASIKLNVNIMQYCMNTIRQIYIRLTLNTFITSRVF